MSSHRNQINCKVVIAIGAAFDIYAGAISRAPRWMQLSCLEWFYRLLQNPKRLWRRYLVYNIHFLWLLLTEQFSTPKGFPEARTLSVPPVRGSAFLRIYSHQRG